MSFSLSDSSTYFDVDTMICFLLTIANGLKQVNDTTQTVF